MISFSSSSPRMTLSISQPRSLQGKSQLQLRSGKAETRREVEMIMWSGQDLIGNGPLVPRTCFCLCHWRCMQMVLSWAFCKG